MVWKIKLLTIAILLGLFQNQMFSQIPIEIVDNSEDIVGSRLVYHVKEKFRESKMFNLLIAPEGPRFQLIIGTMDRFKGDSWFKNVSTMYYVVWLFYDNKKMVLPLYLHSTLGLAGSTVVESAAEGIVAETDKIIMEFAKLLKEIEKLLNPEDN